MAALFAECLGSIDANSSTLAVLIWHEACEGLRCMNEVP